MTASAPIKEQLAVLADLFQDAGLVVNDEDYYANAIRVWPTRGTSFLPATVFLSWMSPPRLGTTVSVEGRGHKGQFAKKLHGILKQVGYDVGAFKHAEVRGGRWYFSASWRG